MKVTIVLVQQQKSDVRRVKQAVVVVPCVKIVQKDFFKEEQVKLNVMVAPSAGVTRATDRPVAMQYHRGHTH
jgi:ABC-type thiamine transport system ATPase subunit